MAGSEPERQAGIASEIGRRVIASRNALAGGVAAIAVLGFAGAPPLLAGAALIAFAAFVIATAAPIRRLSPQADKAVPELAGGFERISARDVADAVGDPIIVFDRAGIITHVNASARAAFGALASGSSLALKFRTPEMQAFLQRVVSGASGPEAIDYVEKVPVERWYRVVSIALGRDAGHFLLMFRDQSEIRRIDRMRADFIANASHELRTPLASVTGFIETLQGPARNDAKAREQFLAIMHGQTQRMARLIDDLLSLSRLEMKGGKPSQKVEVRGLVTVVIDTLDHLAADLGVRIERPAPGEAVWVMGERDELIQVFENLLENACKYGQSGKRVEVTIATPERAGGEVRIAFRDHGPGIPEEHIPRLTERFYRVDAETSRTQKGTGLGLAIVKHILTRHGGRLSITSRVGDGAEFAVDLPTTRAPAGDGNR